MKYRDVGGKAERNDSVKRKGSGAPGDCVIERS